MSDDHHFTVVKLKAIELIALRIYNTSLVQGPYIKVPTNLLNKNFNWLRSLRIK